MDMNKLTLLKKKIEIKKYIDEINEHVDINKYTINDDLTVDAGDVHIQHNGLLKFPFQFGVIHGNFKCWDNKLRSLKGSPKRVGGVFDCGANQLTSLEGGPKDVYGKYDCSYNMLTTLEGISERYTQLECEGNRLTTLEHALKEPYYYQDNPCSPIYDKLGFTEKAHRQCRKVWI